MKTFLSPAWLWLLIAVAGLATVYLLLQLRRKAYAARFTNLELLGSIAPRRPGWRRHLAFALLLMALASLTVAMARPTKNVRVPRDRATVMMAIDVSLSMQATDVEPTRLVAAQRAAKEFVDLLPPRINLGMVSFSGSASVAVSPTTDRAAVKRAIDNLQLSERTAIGEAIFSCLDAIKTFQTQLAGQDGGGPPPPARIVLMSDGSNTWGRTPEQGVTAAKQANVPVSTIAFGTDEGYIELEGEKVAVPVNHEQLQGIADDSGGSYHAAASAGQLSDVYRDIGSQIGYTTERREVTTWLVGTGLLAAFAASGLALFWTNRLL